MASRNSLLQVIWEEEMAFPACQEMFPAVGSLQLRMFIYSCQSMGQNKLVWERGPRCGGRWSPQELNTAISRQGRQHKFEAARIYWHTKALCTNLHELGKKIQQTHFVKAAVSLEMAMDMQIQKPQRHRWPHWDALINMVGSGKPLKGQLDFPAPVWYVARGISLPLCRDPLPGRGWTAGRFAEVDGMISDCSDGMGNIGVHSMFVCVITPELRPEIAPLEGINGC